MSPPLFRVARGALPPVGSTVVLDGAEGKHAGSAVRLRRGEYIRVGDGAGAVAGCTVLAVEPMLVSAEVVERLDVPQPIPTVTIVQALPKSERSELAVELATEAGADRIVPWQASRCVSRWTGAKLAKGRLKWEHAARAAAKQSRRAWEPEIGELVDTAGVAALIAETVRDGGLACLLHEDGAVPLAQIFSSSVGAVGSILLVVGPEGGISDEELVRLSAAGAQAVVLGPQVLRTSTAAAVALGALGVLTPRWAAMPSTIEVSDQTSRE